jgi:hypothetical protein
MTKALYALVGMKHRGTEALVASLPQGEPLTLIREPMNCFDPNAVQVWARDTHVGYIAAKQVKPLALAMDADRDRRAGPLLEQAKAEGKVGALVPNQKPGRLAIDGGRWPMVEVNEGGEHDEA